MRETIERENIETITECSVGSTRAMHMKIRNVWKCSKYTKPNGHERLPTSKILERIGRLAKKWQTDVSYTMTSYKTLCLRFSAKQWRKNHITSLMISVVFFSGLDLYCRFRAGSTIRLAAWGISSKCIEQKPSRKTRFPTNTSSWECTKSQHEYRWNSLSDVAYLAFVQQEHLRCRIIWNHRTLFTRWGGPTTRPQSPKSR